MKASAVSGGALYPLGFIGPQARRLPDGVKSFLRLFSGTSLISIAVSYRTRPVCNVFLGAATSVVSDGRTSEPARLLRFLPVLPLRVLPRVVLTIFLVPRRGLRCVAVLLRFFAAIFVLSGYVRIVGRWVVLDELRHFALASNVDRDGVAFDFDG